MDRFTNKTDKNTYYAESDKIIIENSICTGVAINRLGRFEDFMEDLLKSQNELPDELQKLRNEGKEKTYRYKELMAKKLTAGHILSVLKLYDLY